MIKSHIYWNLLTDLRKKSSFKSFSWDSCYKLTPWMERGNLKRNECSCFPSWPWDWANSTSTPPILWFLFLKKIQQEWIVSHDISHEKDDCKQNSLILIKFLFCPELLDHIFLDQNTHEDCIISYCIKKASLNHCQIRSSWNPPHMSHGAACGHMIG